MGRLHIEKEHLELTRAILALAREIKEGQSQILQKLGVQTMTLDELQAQVQATTDAEDASAQLLTQLAAMIKASASDPVKIQQLSDQLKAHADALSAAVVANTPAAPDATPPATA